MGLYELYERVVFPRLLDVGMRPLERYRGGTLGRARGEVLEIGFGTGLNLAHYPPEVERLVAIDPMQALPRKVGARVEAAPFPVERHALAADGALPFDAGRFDCVTMTWTLCTIPDPVRALREMRRVARAGAPLLFVEHGRSDDPRIARWQDRLDRLEQVVACGCHLTREIDALIRAGGFAIEELRRFDAPGLPRTHGHLYQGVAITP